MSRFYLFTFVLCCAIENMDDLSAHPKIEYLLKMVSKENRYLSLAKRLSEQDDKRQKKEIRKRLKHPEKLYQGESLKNLMDYWEN